MQEAIVNKLTPSPLPRTENDGKCSFVCLSFVGATLLAVFDDGRVFGIADVPADKICRLAASDPKLLAAAIQKLKFLKCVLPTQSEGVDGGAAVAKAVVYAETVAMEEGLGIALVDREKGLMVGTLGSRAGLACPELVRSFAQQQQHERCTDVALLPPWAGSGAGGDVMVVALFGTTHVAVVNVTDAAVVASFRADPCTRIAVLAALPTPTDVPTATDSTSTWKDFVVGLSGSASASPTLYAVVRGEEGRAAALEVGHDAPTRSVPAPAAAAAAPTGLTVSFEPLAAKKDARRLRVRVAAVSDALVDELHNVCVAVWGDGPSPLGALLRAALRSDASPVVATDAAHDLAHLPTCGAVMAALGMALQLHTPEPALRGVATLLAAAERRVEAVGRATADPAREDHLKALAALRRVADTAVLLAATSAGHDDDQHAGAGAAHALFLRLCGGAPPAPAAEAEAEHAALWAALVASGQLAAASVVMARHVAFTAGAGGPLTASFVAAAVASVPEDVPVGEVVAWVDADVLPLLRHHAYEPALATDLAATLARRARAAAARDGHPFAALSAAEAAATVSAAVAAPAAVGGDGGAGGAVARLVHCLRVQAAVWRAWGSDYAAGTVFQPAHPSLRGVTRRVPHAYQPFVPPHLASV